MENEKILFVGDSHGDLGHLYWAIDRADALGADHIMHVGDFGYWEHHLRGVSFLDRLNERLRERGRELRWVDGNHENHTLLRSKYEPREDGLVEVRSNIIYAPRGTRWEWGNKTFLAIGGAYSIDKHGRIPGESWWPEEMVTDAEVERCVSGGEVDVVVAHDVPMFVDLSFHLWAIGVQPWKWYGESVENRSQLTKVFDAVKPKAWFHGHYHLAYTERIDGCRFVGLDANINQYYAKNWQWEWSIELFSTDEIQTER